ncbi:MAG: 50S ribosomal protein L34e [Nanoarchaeota archaeon]
MPSGRFKSRTFRRVHVRTPKGVSTLRYDRRKPKNAHCGRCGDSLKGIPRLLPGKMHNLAKTKKRPERPYGGTLCTKCMRQKIKELAFTKQNP